MELTGSVALVTGAGRGIGRATALALAARGCRTVVSARSEAELAAVAAEAVARGAESLAVPVDLADATGADALMDATLERFGTLDVLVNNAGVLVVKPFLETTIEDYQRSMDINLRAAFVLSRRALEVMREKRSGYIVNVSSTVALGVGPHHAAYGMSKCGMTGMSQSLAAAAKEFGVRVSTIFPDMTDTQMVRDAGVVGGATNLMLPDDIADCIMFLLTSDERMVVRDVVPRRTR